MSQHSHAEQLILKQWAVEIEITQAVALFLEIDILWLGSSITIDWETYIRIVKKKLSNPITLVFGTLIF